MLPGLLQLTLLRAVYGLSEGLMTRLQSVQNAAAPPQTSLVLRARRYDHIMPVYITCTGFQFGDS